jgi:hypothetical protein
VLVSRLLARLIDHGFPGRDANAKASLSITARGKPRRGKGGRNLEGDGRDVVARAGRSQRLRPGRHAFCRRIVGRAGQPNDGGIRVRHVAIDRRAAQSRRKSQGHGADVTPIAAPTLS